jgi:hypothetical protein
MIATVDNRTGRSPRVARADRAMSRRDVWWLVVLVATPVAGAALGDWELANEVSKPVLLVTPVVLGALEGLAWQRYGASRRAVRPRATR